MPAICVPTHTPNHLNDFYDDVSRMQDANKSRSGEDPRISKCLRCRSRISFPGDGKGLRKNDRQIILRGR